MQPLIGVVANNDLSRSGMAVSAVALGYTRSLEKAGGVPVILPFTEELGNLAAMTAPVQGFLFPGGGDINPAFYHEPADAALDAVSEALDCFQMAVFHLACAAGKAVLGICRGIQLANVALGGTLFQDIPSQFGARALEHSGAADAAHPVAIEPGSRLYSLFGPRMIVNSRHHQSIKDPGKDLVVTARAPDGVIEAAQHRHLPIDLVQWHPERMMQQDDAMLPLFRAFVDRCS